MHRSVALNSREFFPLLEKLLGDGHHVKITVTGSSMSPFLRDGVDHVELTPVDFETLRRGDIVLARRKDGEYVLHRVVRIRNNMFFLVGDAQVVQEGPLGKEQLLARVGKVHRGSLEINSSNPLWRALSCCWFYSLFARRVIIAMKRLILDKL